MDLQLWAREHLCFQAIILRLLRSLDFNIHQQILSDLATSAGETHDNLPHVRSLIESKVDTGKQARPSVAQVEDVTGERIEANVFMVSIDRTISRSQSHSGDVSLIQ